MTQVSRFLVLLCSSLVLFASSPITATAVLMDQFNVPTSYPDDSRISPILGRYNVGAQTFTVGMTGTLTGFDVPIGTYSGPGETIDWHYDDMPTPFYAIDLSAYNIFVHTGDQLAILIGGYDPGQEYDRWWGTSLDQYARGTAYENIVARQSIYDSNGNFVGYGLVEYPWVPTPDMGWDVKDFYFATHVEPVPEPSTLLLLASGLAGMAGMAWRRHRQ
jgi:hypothetical protein